MTLLVTDIGTSAVKSFLYDIDSGKLLGSEEVETPTYSPEPGAYESDAEDWHEGLVSTAAKLVARFPDRKIKALALTDQQISCVLLDGAGRPVHRAILWADSRSTAVLASHRERIAPDLESNFEQWFSEHVGIPYSDRWGLAKALWLRDAHPAAYARAEKIASVDAYLALTLTGNYVSDISNATFFSLDIATGRFNTEVLSRFDVSPDYFPETVPSGSVIGELLAPIAEQIGLPGPIPVIISGSDQPCSMVGSNAAQAGDVVINLGSGSFVLATMPQAVTDPRIMTNFSVQDDHWVAMGTHYLTGTAFRWLRDMLGWKRELTYEELDAAASAVPAGSDGLIFIPSLTGSGTPDWRSDARGVMAGLSIEHSPGHLARAVMESTGYGLRLIIETFESLGIQVQRIFLTGGATTSHCWSQTITDILNREIHLPDSRQATARGAFLLALVGLGYFSNISEAAKAHPGNPSVLSPGASAVSVYQKHFHDYLYWKDAENRFRSTLERSRHDVD